MPLTSAQLDHLFCLDSFSAVLLHVVLGRPPRGGVPCRGGKAFVTLRPPGLCRREPCAPGRSNHAGLVCAVRVQTKAAPAGEPFKPPKGGKTLTENHWPSRSWGLGGRPITCPQKIQKITETCHKKTSSLLQTCMSLLTGLMFTPLSQMETTGAFHSTKSPKTCIDKW